MPTAERRATHRERITRVLEVHRRGCDVRVLEPDNGWSYANLVREHGYWVVFLAVLAENSAFLGLLVPGVKEVFAGGR